MSWGLLERYELRLVGAVGAGACWSGRSWGVLERYELERVSNSFSQWMLRMTLT